MRLFLLLYRGWCCYCCENNKNWFLQLGLFLPVDATVEDEEEETVEFDVIGVDDDTGCSCDDVVDDVDDDDEGLLGGA